MRMHNPQYALACSQPLATRISHGALVFLEHSGHHAAGTLLPPVAVRGGVRKQGGGSGQPGPRPPGAGGWQRRTPPSVHGSPERVTASRSGYGRSFADVVTEYADHMNLVLMESLDGSWTVESVIDDGRHRYQIIHNGEVHAEAATLVEVHRVLTEVAALAPLHFGVDHTGLDAPEAAPAITPCDPR
jgi:hypothetical protein